MLSPALRVPAEEPASTLSLPSRMWKYSCPPCRMRLSGGQDSVPLPYVTRSSSTLGSFSAVSRSQRTPSTRSFGRSFASRSPGSSLLPADGTRGVTAPSDDQGCPSSLTAGVSTTRRLVPGDGTIAPHPAAPHQGTSPVLIRGRKGFRQTVLCGQARPVKRGWRRRPHGAQVRAGRAWRSAGRHEDACQAGWQHPVVPRGLVRSWCSGFSCRLRGRPGPRTTPLPGSAWARLTGISSGQTFSDCSAAISWDAASSVAAAESWARANA